MSQGEYSVCQFFEDGSSDYIKRYVSDEEAVNTAIEYTDLRKGGPRPAVLMGIIHRVIVTDGGDCLCFEWIKGKGLVFPTKEDIEESRKNDSDNSIHQG